MYEAKRQGRNSFKIYDQAMRKATQEYLQIETFLQTAIENDEFELFFQPKFDIKANKINSMEALLRWNHPILGNVPAPIPLFQSQKRQEVFGISTNGC